MQLGFGNGGDGDVSDVGHAGESLAAKAHRLNALQVLKRGQLGGRVALAEYGQVLKTDSVAVVGDLDEFEAAILDEEADGGGGGVEAVLHELLHGGDGALDDLAGGDSVHHRLAQPLNFRGLHSPLILALFHSDRFNVLNAKGSNSSLNAFIHNFSIRLASPLRGLNL